MPETTQPSDECHLALEASAIVRGAWGVLHKCQRRVGRRVHYVDSQRMESYLGGLDDRAVKLGFDLTTSEWLAHLGSPEENTYRLVRCCFGLVLVCWLPWDTPTLVFAELRDPSGPLYQHLDDGGVAFNAYHVQDLGHQPVLAARKLWADLWQQASRIEGVKMYARPRALPRLVDDGPSEDDLAALGAAFS